MRQTIKEDICPVCHKKAYLRRIRTWGGFGRLGWICTKCRNWWEDDYFDMQKRRV